MTSFGWNGADPVQVADTTHYEMGTEYITSVDVTLTHIRVFSGGSPIDVTGRTGRVWSTTGTQLGSAVLADSLPAGWGVYPLAAPIAAPAGTRFVVSFSTNGNYAATAHAFDAEHASGDGALIARKTSDAVNGNGVFLENTPGSFPIHTFNATFYGVDIGYDLGISGNTAPMIDSLGLVSDGLSVTATITATDAQTLAGATYLIDWGDGNQSASAVASHTYASGGLKAILASVTDAGGLSDFAAGAVSLVDPVPAGMNVVAIRDTLISHALSLGLFSSVSGFEPKAAPLDGLYGALWLNGIAPARNRSGLTSTTMRLEFSFRIGQNMIAEPQEEIDLQILVATAALMDAYSGDFELGRYVEEIDLLGAYGDPLQGRAGYLNQDSRLYRVMVITIPIIVNDVFTQSP